MSHRLLAMVAIALVGALATSEARAQDRPTATVSIYRVAPGQHLAFLEWIGEQDSAVREAGGPASQWYVHQDGDAWDYVGITPETTQAIDDRADEILRQRGRKTGFQGGLEFRQYISYHTDTIAWGPATIQEILAAAKE